MAQKNIKRWFDSIAELVDFNFYYLVLIKYKKILLIVPLFITALAFLITLNIEPIYQSSATLVIESKYRLIVFVAITQSSKAINIQFKVESKILMHHSAN